MTSRRFLVVEADAGQMLAAAKAAGIVPPTAELENAAVSRTFDDPDEGPPQKVLLRFTDASFPEVPEACAAATVKADVSLAETGRYVPPWAARQGDGLARSAGRVGVSPPPARPHFTPPTPRE